MSDILGPWFDFVFSSLTNSNILCFGDFIGDRAKDIAQDFDYYLKNYPKVSNILLPSTFQPRFQRLNRESTQTSGYFTHELDVFTGLVMNRLNRNLGDLPKVTEDLQRAMLSWCTWTLRTMWDPNSKWYRWRSRDGMITINELRNDLTNRYYLGILNYAFRIHELDQKLLDSLANETWLAVFIHDNNLQPIELIRQQATVIPRGDESTEDNGNKTGEASVQTEEEATAKNSTNTTSTQTQQNLSVSEADGRAANEIASETEVKQENSLLVENEIFSNPPEEANVPYYYMPELSPFDKKYARLWFCRTEATLRLAGIRTERTKADVVFINLKDPSVARVALEIIESPDEKAPYTKLKKHMIYYFQEETLRNRLIGKIDSRNAKPSRIFAQICHHAGTGYIESVLRSVFLEYLPVRVQQLMDSYKSESLLDFVNYGDVITRSLDLPTDDKPWALPQVTAVDLSKEIRELKDLLMKQNRRSRSRSRNRSAGLCRFHKKYADKAHNCVEPCSWNIMF